MEKEKDSTYQRCIHPSFNRQTLTTLQDSINTISFDLHEAIPPCTEKRKSAFLVFSCFHKYLDTVLVEIVLYFPCALAPFHFFENSTCCVCERKSLLEVKCGVMAQHCWFIAQ